MKKIRSLVIIVILIALVLLVGCKKDNTIELSFDGISDVQILSEKDGNVAKFPSFELNEDETLLGFATVENSSVVQIQNNEELNYVKASTLATNGKLKLYKVIKIDHLIEVEFEGITEKTILSSYENNTLIVPSYESNDKVFKGWGLEEQALEVKLQAGAKIAYNDIKDLTTSKTIKFYPVLEDVDLKVAVFDRYINRDLELTADEVLDLIKVAFDEYLIANNYENINILYRHYTSESVEDFGASVNNDADIDIIIGCGANIATTGGVNIIVKGKQLAKYSGDGKRYCALLTENKYAIALYCYMTDSINANVDVTVKANENDETGINGIVNSIKENELDVTSFAYLENRTFLGWSNNASDTEAKVGTKITYEAVKDLAVDGKVTLYPIYASINYDLVVEMIIGTSSKVYITEDDINTIDAIFKEALKKANIDSTNINVQYLASFAGKGEDFIAQLHNPDLVVGASNLTTQGTGLKLYNGIKWANITNGIVNTSRYCGIIESVNKDHVNLATIMYTTLTGLEEKTIEITMYASLTDTVGVKTILNSLFINNATLPEYAISEGKELEGWATSSEATAVNITTNTITYEIVKDLAVDGKVTLYPIFKEIDANPAVLRVAINNSAKTKTYFTAEEIASIKAGFIEYLTAQGITNASSLNIVWDEIGGVNVAGFASQVNENGKYNVVLAGNTVNTDENCSVTLATDGTETLKAKIVGVTLANTSRYVGVVADSSTNIYAMYLYNYLKTAKAS